MARVFITGSADGLGRLAAQRLVEAGHEVVLHARSEARAREALRAVPGAGAVLVGDLSSIAETRALARQANAAGPLDAVIHNAGIYLQPRRETPDGVEQVFAVNVLAPYVLTALVPARRLVYVTSGMHRGGDPDLGDLAWRSRRWSASQAYSDSKLLLVALAFAAARRWPAVRANAVDPGWVPTKMGGPAAPDDLDEGARTQVWLATSDAPGSQMSGSYFFHMRPRAPHPAASDAALQEALLRACAERSGVGFPAQPEEPAGAVP
jgi:NAD(P)-dependent dehydrogenase (short-subunit alcohol dehydrogenase family)